MTVQITFSHGIVIRQKALEDRGVSKADLLKLFEVDRPLGESVELISFGPNFGAEACDEFIRRLQKSGLVYLDDFFDLALDHPEWLKFYASLS